MDQADDEHGCKADTKADHLGFGPDIDAPVSNRIEHQKSGRRDCGDEDRQRPVEVQYLGGALRRAAIHIVGIGHARLLGELAATLSVGLGIASRCSLMSSRWSEG